MEYPERLLQYFYNMEHAGQLSVDQPTIRVAELGKIQQGDVFRLYLECEAGRIKTARFQAYGSVVLLSLAEFACCTLEGKTYDAAKQIRANDLLQALGLTRLHVHSAVLIERAIKKTVEG